MHGCNKPGCENPHYSLGLCKNHYLREYYKQTSAINACSVDGCDRVHMARGYCKNHYRRMKNKGVI